MASSIEDVQRGIQRTPTMVGAVPSAALARPRLFFVDNLRSMLTILVVLHHLAITYGAAGSWYYQDPVRDEVTTIVLTIFTATNQAFFMGLFFFIAGYFTPGAYDRKGAAVFLRDRLLRLGIPLLIYDLIVNPFVISAADGFRQPYWRVWGDYLRHFSGIGTGPLWFVETLLILAGLYTLTCGLSNRQNIFRAIELPSHRMIVAFLLVLAVVTFAIRLWLPIGWDFEPLNLQLPFFPQYLSLFAIGVIAFRGNWLLKIPDALGKVWLRIAIAAIIALPILLVAGGALQHIEFFVGGPHWQAATYALWEECAGLGLCLGLLVFFRGRVRQQWKWSQLLAANAYTVYLIHAPVIVILAYALHGIELYPLLKFALAAFIAVPLCFVISHGIRKLPLAREIL